jgi:predicted double-glycine peptidase
MLSFAALLAQCVSGCAIHTNTASRAASAQARGPVLVEISPAGGDRFRDYVTSARTLNREHVVMQQYDYSCGAAALTTMFVYYFEDRVTEQQVLDAIFRRLAQAENPKAAIEDRVKNGLSMLDLQQVSADLGYQSAVARITLKQALELKAPVVVRLVKHDFKHFVVFRGIVDDRVFLADPIRGNLRMSLAQFQKQWNGVALFLGKEGFGLPDDHPLAVRAVSPVQHELEAARRSLFPWP